MKSNLFQVFGRLYLKISIIVKFMETFAFKYKQNKELQLIYSDIDRNALFLGDFRSLYLTQEGIS